MAAVCELCGKHPSFGMNLSHSHRRTKRRWDPNIQRVRALVKEHLGKLDPPVERSELPARLSGEPLDLHSRLRISAQPALDECQSPLPLPLTRRALRLQALRRP